MQETNIYYGPRDESFRSLIVSLLKRGKLKNDYILSITDERGMDMYSQVFTHNSVDRKKNYEYFEILGDSTINKGIVWYLYRKFPQLNCPEGVKILSRLKISLVSKKSFSTFADKLGFWGYISASEQERRDKKKSILEDVFEAFFAATEILIDTKIKLGAGYAICYNIITSLFDETEISLRYEDLFDAKTRLKEIFDHYRILGNVKYEAERKEDNLSHVIVYQVKGNSKIPIGTGIAALKADAEQKAAEEAIRKLNALGYIREIPSEYRNFCTF